MGDVTRRDFVKTSAGAAALGAMPRASAPPRPRPRTHRHIITHPIVAWIGDPRDGKITVMSGKHEVTIRDHKLGEPARARRALSRRPQ